MIIIDGGLANIWPHSPQHIDLALRAGGGVSIIESAGVTAIAIDGIPSDRILSIMGERMPSGADDDRWSRVWVKMHQGTIANQRMIGFVPVDEARLMVVDAEALAKWDDEKSQDGLADVVFWDRDAIAVAREFGAEKI